ncbi:MAG: response regulator [Actinomycetota bacterium]|nr:response regulator [Actinomycetota bacterium]
MSYDTAMAPDGTSETPPRRIILVEDEDFTRQAVSDSLAGAGLDVRAVTSVAEALSALGEFEPHAVITDLDLGPGPSGVDLLQRISADFPWIGLVVLTAHRSVELAVGRSDQLPADAVMLVKSALDSMDDIPAAIEQAITQVGVHRPDTSGVADEIIISSVQAEILHLMAEGLSNAGIASRRGTSLRAAEAAVQRTMQALGIAPSPEYNSRVLAVRRWQSGHVTVR